MALKEAYSTTELLSLLEVSFSSSIIRRAEREGWQSQKCAGRGGGKEWLLSSMPEETRVAIRAAEEKQALMDHIPLLENAGIEVGDFGGSTVLLRAVPCDIEQDNLEDMHKVVAYLLEKETITGGEMVAIIEGRDPALVEDAYASTRKQEQPAFRPSQPDRIEPPARHIHIVSEEIKAPPLVEEDASDNQESQPSEDAPDNQENPAPAEGEDASREKHPPEDDGKSDL